MNLKTNKKFIYLLSPSSIKNNKFFADLVEVLSTNKISFFQLRLKGESYKKSLSIAKKAKRICTNEQKVIKVPNTDVFRIVAPILISRGISRIISSEQLIAL